jgi:hypothetical protein
MTYVARKPWIKVDFKDVDLNSKEIKYRLFRSHGLKLLWDVGDQTYEAEIPEALEKAIYNYIDNEGYTRKIRASDY